MNKKHQSIEKRVLIGSRVSGKVSKLVTTLREPNVEGSEKMC